MRDEGDGPGQWQLGINDLYSKSNEHDACGVGFLADLKGVKSHRLVADAVKVLQNLVHRGAAGGDGKTGDGAGLLLQIPDEFFRRAAKAQGVELPSAGSYGLGMLFLPRDRKIAKKCRAIVEKSVASEDFEIIGWRDVPVDTTALGEIAEKARPDVVQFFVTGKAVGDDLERRLYVLRRVIEKSVQDALDLGDEFYVVSLSARTVVYKGMLMGGQIAEFYADLNSEDFTSAMAVLHQRYSTNTFPSWKLSQPFRYLAHNGEINTLRGNKMQMRSRQQSIESELFGSSIKKLLPVIDESGSDSACLDNVLELLCSGGRDLPHAMMMLMPQAWGRKYPIGPDHRGFFEYHAGLMEPWDGPAAVAFMDGRIVGACLDRNGLRPARYTITSSGLVIVASETGVLDVDPAQVVERGALRPGEIFIVDTVRGRILKNAEVKAYYTRRLPYRRWVEENRIELHGLFGAVAPVEPDRSSMLFRQRLFGYSREDLQVILGAMASTGNEPVGSMGSDTPLAVLSEKPQLLYCYFKQLFAQVTNPPIDPIREELVMSLLTFMGNRPNILHDDPRNAQLIKLPHPVLSNDDLVRLKSGRISNFKSSVIKMQFPVSQAGGTLEQSLESLCETAVEKVRSGINLLVLSDNHLDGEMAPVPALLAVSAIHQRLIREGLRTGASLIVETGEAREVHHLAVLLGFGATAVNPYLAFETIADLVLRDQVEGAGLSVTRATENYIHALCKGLLKIMSKMGISTLRSYRNAQVFEIVGINSAVVSRYFTDTSTRIEGIGLDEISEEARLRYLNASDARNESLLLETGGVYKYRKDGEKHLWSPESISTLQRATRENDELLYRKYAEMINEQSRNHYTLRGLFRFRKSDPVPLDSVEPAEAIMKRFVTSAMSFGSISREAHETLAIAMNRIGAMSNSGEGGEDPARYRPMDNGDSRCSAVKQVASGRFGVTNEYLVNAKELQIKIAQGAKPGEGGQLPGHKVNEEIARVRHSTPGVTLISPPPHHDIYSIEDIKQLIYDLKNVNPDARISVKLVSEAGVGTVAAGVAKGKADMVLIAGYDGGTGASPLSSIKHAGAPWELGLAETQQTLVANRLRGRIRVQADGQMKTGRDIVIASLLGAEEFGFATAPLVVCGCVMMRKCHKNTCPVGVATQDPELRKRYSGRPEYVINFFRMLASEVREYMAQLGFRTMDEMTGRSDMLEFADAIAFWKARGLDFSRILVSTHGGDRPVRCLTVQDHDIGSVMDKDLIRLADDAVNAGGKVRISKTIRNVDRSVGAMLSGVIARKYGFRGLPADSITIDFAGSAGQSFGAFAAHGMTLRLKGEANDYVGKGLSGGRIVVTPFDNTSYDPSGSIICGNVLLYGAVEGEVFIYGRAGERFCIRNSGCKAVVEGVGDHGCEYMTGGRVVVLGTTGVNFAAGMSGGIAYVYDEDRGFEGRCNLDMVDLETVADAADIAELRGLIEKHFSYTGSRKARAVLDDWDESLAKFVKVLPMEYRRVLGKMTKEDEATEREEVVNG